MKSLLDLFKLLSDETRLRILVLLYKEELCVCELCGILELTQPKVSKNLAKLRDMGFVQDDRREKYVYYRLVSEDAVLRSLLEGIWQSASEYPQIQKDLLRVPERATFFSHCQPAVDLKGLRTQKEA